MKKLILSTLFIMCVASSFAQSNQVVKEPEFINNYCLMTSDSSFVVLPKESGTIKSHQNKVSKWSKIVGGVSSAVGAAGLIVGVNANSVGALSTGVKTMTTASGVSQMADAAGSLAGANGMDIVFEGPHSSYVIPKDMKTISLVIKAKDNESDPMELYRIVRFNSSKKDRRIQWMEFSPTILGSEKAQKSGYVNFVAHKYGNQSYILTFPENEMIPGEYGIFFFSIINGTTIPVGTFSIAK